MKSAPSIAFDYVPSRGLRIALAGIGALAVVAPWLSALPAGLCSLSSITAFALAWRAERTLSAAPFRRVAYRGDGWTLRDAQGVEQPALLHSYRHLGGFVTLGWRLARGARWYIVLTPDNLDAQTRRSLVVLLRRVARADGAAPELL